MNVLVYKIYIPEIVPVLPQDTVLSWVVLYPYIYCNGIVLVIIPGISGSNIYIILE